MQREDSARCQDRQKRCHSRRQTAGQLRAQLVAHRLRHALLVVEQRREQVVGQRHVHDELVRFAIRLQLPAGESVHRGPVELQRARLFGLDLLQRLDAAQAEGAADVEVRRGEALLQVDGRLVLRQCLLRVALQQVDVAEVVVHRGEPERARAAGLERALVELFRAGEVTVALRLARQGEVDRQLVGAVEPLLQPLHFRTGAEAVLDQPHVDRRPAIRGHPGDALGHPRRCGQNAEQRAGEHHFDGGGIERDRQQDGEDERHRPHLQKDRQQKQNQRQHLRLPAARADREEVVDVVRVEVGVAREEHQHERQGCREQPDEERPEDVGEHRARDARIVPIGLHRGRHLVEGRLDRGGILGHQSAGEAEVRFGQGRSELDRELAALHREDRRAGGQGLVTLADERAADEEEVLDGEVVLQLPDVLLLVVGAALVAVAQIVAARAPVRLDVGALLDRHDDAAVGERLRRRRGRRRGIAGAGKRRIRNVLRARRERGERECGRDKSSADPANRGERRPFSHPGILAASRS